MNNQSANLKSNVKLFADDTSLISEGRDLFEITNTMEEASHDKTGLNSRTWVLTLSCIMPKNGQIRFKSMTV